MSRRVCLITGTRADYGLLRPLMRKISQDDELQLQLIVTGSHLAPEFGLTWTEIERDGFHIDERVEILMSSDSDLAVCKSMGIVLIELPGLYKRLRPDIIVGLGDRFELFAAVAAAQACRVPHAHIHGGELTLGAFDDAFRHAITKMSLLHFTSTEDSRRRVIQLGEAPERVFRVGALGLDNIVELSPLSREDVERELSCRLGERNLLVTVHPQTLDPGSARAQFEALLDVLHRHEHTRLIFTKANADPEGRVINELIDEFVASHWDRAVAFSSLGQRRYLSTMRIVDGVVGNSSSGIIEAPSFHVGTVNIGDRQKGRVKASSVIDCEPTVESIESALRTLYSAKFRKKLPRVTNPYGDGHAAERIVEVLKRDLPSLKKGFHDLPDRALRKRSRAPGVGGAQESPDRKPNLP